MTKRGRLSKREYDFIYGRVPRATVDIVVRASEGTLFCYRIGSVWPNTWGLPGGRIHLGETLFTAARRIVRTETGLVIKPEKIIGTIEFPNERSAGRRRHTISTVVFARPQGGLLKPDQTSKEVRYFKRLPPRPTRPHAMFLLEKGLIRR